VDGKAGKEPARRCALARLFLALQIRCVAFLGLWLTDFGAARRQWTLDRFRFWTDGGFRFANLDSVSASVSGRG